MNNVNERFVAMPSLLKLSESKIKYQDALTYVAIRSFLNSSTKECFPSVETIAYRSGTSKRFVENSTSRLERSGLITVNRSTVKHASNRYAFQDFDSFQKIPYELFDHTALNYTEKAMLLCLRQFFNYNLCQTYYQTVDFATHLGLTYRTVNAQYNSLVSKGYIYKLEKIYRGKKISSYNCLSDKINWLYSYKKEEEVYNTSALMIC
jgi:predicted transcriptional regulator